jgi:methionine-rich copper-binding protein CopC
MPQIILFFVLFFSVTVNVSAHSVLERSDPSEGETVQSIENVSLTFSTELEQASKLTLEDPFGDTISPNETDVVENSLTGSFTKDQFQQGSYILHWKIVGNDGHPIEGEIPFTLKLDENDANENQEVESEMSEGEAAEMENNKQLSVAPFMLMIALLIGVGGLLVYRILKR